mmetsp:Transcript_12784/g.21617  ORF Transcript_12784/g.21617 Transcript_12784/m.21617 type:complete len:406 (+) Transcript_12784:1219-2436(+)
MSAKKPRSKVGSLDWEINYLAKVLFVVMLVISLLIIVMDGFMGSWYFKYFRCLLLMCSIIPISMRINLDFAKLYYSYKINTDERIKDTVARNSTIPEELGRIQFLLSDKTGTLTKNDMIFKKLNLEYISFTDEDIEDIRKLLNDGLKKERDKFLSIKNNRLNSNITSEEGFSMLDPDGFAHPAEQISVEVSRFNSSSRRSLNDYDRGSNVRANQPKIPKRKGKRRKDEHQLVVDLFLALILCHNVTPVYTSPEEKVQGVNETQDMDGGLERSESEGYQFRVKQFQASSPDEIALVKFAESLGMILEDRDEQFISITDANGNKQEYEILEIFPFSSENKRMGIIVRSRESKQIMFYLKGAEVVMEKKVRPDQRASLTEACEQLAQDGLRTLVISQKTLNESEFQDF